MSQTVKIRDGKTFVIYDDASMHLMESLGQPLIKRATHVEFDNSKRMWVATLADMGADSVGIPGTVIAETKTRKEAIDAEIAYLKIHM
jgi:hypothetical protein